MDSSEESVDLDLRQRRLSKFGQVLGCVTLGYVGLVVFTSIYVGSFSVNRVNFSLLVAGAAFTALWLLLRGRPRSPRFVRAVELSTLFVGTAAFSTMALVLDLTASPDMVVRSALTYMLLVYAVYVPSKPQSTLVLAGLMTLPLLGCIFIAFRAWDPALHDPPAAIWRRGEVGDMAYPATIASAIIWGIAVAIAVGFSRAIYGLRKAVRDVRRLGQYTLERKLGEGGMGVVYRASHAMLRRPTAVKLLLPDRTGKDALARFEREVRRTAMLAHPNTVTVFDYGRTTDGVFYYAMELLEGTSLEEIVEIDGPQPEERVIHLLSQVAASLAEAHAAGLVHRDIKPGNILVVDRAGIPDLVKVVDFGLVKDLSPRAGDDSTSLAALTMTNAIAGTPLYIAPETLSEPETADGRADLYALGAVGYWLLTGTHVFGGKSLVEICAHHLHTAPEPPSKRSKLAVSADLEELLLACLAKRPEQRPASAAALGDALGACERAGQWTNARAARWWADNKHKMRSYSGGTEPRTPSRPASLLTMTRVPESAP